MSKNYNKRISDTTIRLGEVRFGYVNVFEPRKDKNGNPDKYSVCVLIPKTDKQAIQLIEDAINAAKEKGKSGKWGGKVPGRLTTPLRDGDEEEKGEEFEGMMFLNASAQLKSKPGVRVLDGGMIVEALDTDDFYSGCWGAVTLAFFPYDSEGNKGVGAGLNNVIKTRDDEKLAGGASAESDFGDMAD
jgi:hypothetical protein